MVNFFITLSIQTEKIQWRKEIVKNEAMSNNIMFLDIIHGSDFILKSDVSETGFCRLLWSRKRFGLNL